MTTSTRSGISPLRATMVAALLLAAAAVPLAKLTGRAEAPQPSAEPSIPRTGSLPCVLRLRTFDPLENLSLRAADGTLLFSTSTLPPGETEHDITLPIIDQEAALHLRAHAGSKDTAVSVTLLPDGLEDKTLWLDGTGGVDGTLRFDWNPPDTQ
jgi:hypothetical protein